ncbi:MAG: FKBP-type peptidyl-prolyl cis-trans isomerase [Spirochaetales bacterium]|nr:FKBP-type peptidyl-prolyl cis-trans isomerase [Spirochaetales bacterium]
MKYFSILVLIVFLGLTGCNKNSTETADNSGGEDAGETKNKLSYALGISIGGSLKDIGVDIDIASLSRGVTDIMSDKEGEMTPEEANTFIQQELQKVQAQKGEAKLLEGQKFLEENKKKKGVITTESGLQYMVIKEGTGAKPKATDTVSVHYTGTLIDGTVFDSSVERGEPIEFNVGGVIPGWTEALQLINVGSKYKIFIPSNLAYGEQGAGGQIGPNEVLIFELELLAIK